MTGRDCGTRGQSDSQERGYAQAHEAYQLEESCHEEHTARRKASRHVYRPNADKMLTRDWTQSSGLKLTDSSLRQIALGHQVQLRCLPISSCLPHGCHMKLPKAVSLILMFSCLKTVSDPSASTTFQSSGLPFMTLQNLVLICLSNLIF